MPPTKKISTEPKPSDFFPPPVAPSFLEVGMLVNLVSGGRTLPNYEILDFDATYLKVRGSLQVAPQTEIVLIPHAQIAVIGLVGVR